MSDTSSPVASSRRAFLASGVVAPAAAAFLPVSGAAQTTTGGAPHVLKLGAVTYNIAKDWDVPTIIKNLSTVGYDAVELRTTHAHGVELSLTAGQRAEVRKQFEASPVRIGGLGTTCEFHAADPAVLRKNIEETKQWVQLARDLGCPGGKVRPNGLPKEVPEERTLQQIAEQRLQRRQRSGVQLGRNEPPRGRFEIELRHVSEPGPTPTLPRGVLGGARRVM